MKNRESLEFEVQLENKERDGHTTVTVRVEVDEQGRAQAKGLGDGIKDDEYEISFVVRPRHGQGGNHCWMCFKEPCPPGKMTWVSNCHA